jgi:glycosyltransferase involved in cell wall biosynthesis
VARAPTVVQLLPALEAGGVERATLEIGQALVARGARSLVVSAGGRLVPQLEREGSEHIALDLGRKSLRTLRHVAALRRLFESERPALVHARSRLPAWIAHFALRRLRGARPALVTSVHGLNSPGRYSAILTRGERVICVSETVRRYVLAHYPKLDAGKLRVIPRGIDPAAFPFGHEPSPAWHEAFRSEFPQLAGGKLLVLPGRGTRLKGHDTAIRLLAALRSQGFDAKLLLLGARESGREAYVRELEALAVAMGVADRLAICAPRHDVRDVLARAALVLQLSNKPEAFGRTVAEALSLGRPVLGLDHGGVGEILAQHFPAGLVPVDARGRIDLGDELPVLNAEPRALSERAAALLDAPPTMHPYRGPALADMQRATLAVYAELIDV